MTKAKDKRDLLRNPMGEGKALPFKAQVRIDNTTYYLGSFTTREEAKAEQARFRAEGNKPGMVLSRCYCQRQAVWVPQSWIMKMTKSCGRPECRHPAMQAS